MYFFTTHRLERTIDWVPKDQEKTALIFTHTGKHKHNALLHNSPSNVENGLGRNKERRYVLISAHTLTQKHNALLHNSPPTVENGLDRKQGKVVHAYFHLYTNTIQFFTTHQLMLRMDWARKKGKAVFISTHTLTHKHNMLLHNSLAKM